jgi:hypothetical protein
MSAVDPILDRSGMNLGRYQGMNLKIANFFLSIKTSVRARLYSCRKYSKLIWALAPAKINPACTSHTDRASGVDVLPPPVAGAASGGAASFSHAHSFGMRYDLVRSRRPKPTQIKLRPIP